MARTKYQQILQQVYAAKYKGDNLSELEEVAPGQIVVQDGKPFLNGLMGLIPIEVTDWVVEDAEFMTVMSNTTFSAKFNINPVLKYE